MLIFKVVNILSKLLYIIFTSFLKHSSKSSGDQTSANSSSLFSHSPAKAISFHLGASWHFKFLFNYVFNFFELYLASHFSPVLGSTSFSLDTHKSFLWVFFFFISFFLTQKCKFPKFAKE